jgi:hypothetical protein
MRKKEASVWEAVRVDEIDSNKLVSDEDLVGLWLWDGNVGILQCVNATRLADLNSFHRRHDSLKWALGEEETGLYKGQREEMS